MILLLAGDAGSSDLLGITGLSKTTLPGLLGTGTYALHSIHGGPDFLRSHAGAAISTIRRVHQIGESIERSVTSCA